LQPLATVAWLDAYNHFPRLTAFGCYWNIVPILSAHLPHHFVAWHHQLDAKVDRMVSIHKYCGILVSSLIFTSPEI